MNSVWRRLCCALAAAASGLGATTATAAEAGAPAEVRFSRHVVAVFSRLGCNGGSCHGAVQGKNGFRLSLFGARPEEDFQDVVRRAAGRRVQRQDPEQSLLLLKATARVPHGGGQRMAANGPEFRILAEWIARGARFDDVAQSRVVGLTVTPRDAVLAPEQELPLRVEATFADGSQEDVTGLCSFESRDEAVATVTAEGLVRALGVGDAAVIVRFRSEPALAQVLVPRPGNEPFPPTEPKNFIDEHLLAKLRRLNLPPAGTADDATFLRRVRLDVTGQLPTPAEVRGFLADTDPAKRDKLVERLLAEPGHAALWTLKFCDLWKASDYGVYADGLAEHYEGPRFHAWVRSRLSENTPYDELAARVLGATSRDGRSLEEWAAEVTALQEGYVTPRTDLDLYAKRRTLDIYWQRREAVGLPGAMQVAHAFLGLRMECAQCHRHPHDIWQQDDLLSFTNFFMRVRTVGFQGDNEKRFPEEGAIFKRLGDEGKRLEADSKALKEGKAKELAEKAKTATPMAAKLKADIARLEAEATQARDAAQKQPEQAAELRKQAQQRDEQVAAARKELEPLEAVLAENDAVQKQVRDLERRGKLLGDEIAKRVLHAQVLHLSDDAAAKRFASVTSPLGTQSSTQFRLLGETAPLDLKPEEDPRQRLVDWLRRPDNPFFAKALVNRVWAHYFGRGLIDPPDDLSPLNPPTHPELLAELCRQFIAQKYDLRWLHRELLRSRAYQQSGQPHPLSQADRSNYAWFYYRRLPAEVLLDALNQATGTREDLDMKYYHWPDGLRMVELPYMPRNPFVTFMLEQFGRPPRNSSVQCDCERQAEASMLQVLTFANHPRVWQKIADPSGRVAAIVKEVVDPAARLDELFLNAVGRTPAESERAACQRFIESAESVEKGLQAVLWSLLNSKEFLLQH